MRKVSLIIVAIALFWQVSSAQPGFSYQGSLKNAGAPANGNHDFEFRLWDSESGGAQVGTTVTLNGVAVTNGIFSVTLSFGNQFPNAPRYLDIRVRPVGGGAFTTLTPREQIKAVPYSVTSLNAETATNAINATNATTAATATNALQLGGVAANQYVTTTTGGANFIQNTATQQASSNFNISGNGVIGGNVGIGTTTPNFKLHVAGQDIRVEGNTTSIFPRFSLNFTGGGTDAKKWQNYARTEGLMFSALNDAENTENIWMRVSRGTGTAISSVSFPTGNVGIGIAAPTNKFQVLGTSSFDGNVGIGTPAPQQTLHVNGQEVLSTGSQAGFKFRDRGSTLSTDDWVWYSTGNIARFFRAGVGDLVSVQTNGNVGIGTVSPNAKLDVNGTIQSSSGGFKFPDGSVQASANTAYTQYRDDFVQLSSPDQSVLQLNLPAGSYLVSTSIAFQDANLITDQEVRCRFEGDGQFTHHLMAVLAPGFGNSTFSAHTIRILPSPGTLNLMCSKVTSGVNTYFYIRQITAIRVADNVIVQ